ncbi:hypothetical protein BDR05DRAFT_970592, partial [Suillus weaverae]
PFDSTTPSWTYSQGIDTTPARTDWVAGESARWKVYNIAEEQTRLLLISGIVPRPITFVSTISEKGLENLAPFSWFNTV